jgi:hypothetical protein
MFDLQFSCIKIGYGDYKIIFKILDEYYVHIQILRKWNFTIYHVQKVWRIVN